MSQQQQQQQQQQLQHTVSEPAAAPSTAAHQLQASHLDALNDADADNDRSQQLLQQQHSYPGSTPSLPRLHHHHHHHHHHQHNSSSGGGLNTLTPHGSAPSSPTAASEYSVATTHGSTSSAVPFSHIAQQRKQQERETALQEAAQTLLHDAAAAFDLRMQSYYMQDIAALQEMNEAAAQQYGATAEIATALGQFVSDLVARQAAAKEALSVLPQLDRQLEVLSTAVSQLDKHSRQLEVRLGLKPLSSSSTTGAMYSSSSSAYSYLASSVASGVTQLTAVGVSTASAGLGCLGGGGGGGGAATSAAD